MGAHMKKDNCCFKRFPTREYIYKFINEVRSYLFVGYFEKVSGSKESFRKKKIKKISSLFRKHICCNKDNLKRFIDSLSDLEVSLNKDLDFFFESDPASESKDEIILAYPGFLAITYYRNPFMTCYMMIIRMH